MSVPVAVKAPVLVPFVCPACAAPNATALVALSRAGGLHCARCNRWLRVQDVMRAMHAPRKAA